MLVHFPIALLPTAVAMECLAHRHPLLTRPAAGILVAGVVLGWLAALFGLISYFTVPSHTEEAHILMWWHLGFALTTLVVFTGISIKRWKGRNTTASRGELAAGLVGTALVVVTGYLGGVIVYHGGAGIEPSLLSPQIRSGHHHGAGDEEHKGSASDRSNDHSH